MKIINRNLFTLVEGKSIGYIDSVYKSGIIFSTNYIQYYEPNSKLSKLSTNKIHPDKIKKLEYYMNRKIPICIDFSIHLFGSPLKGDVLFSYYIEDINLLNEEIINIKEESINGQYIYN